jgi:hypothetical protein
MPGAAALALSNPNLRVKSQNNPTIPDPSCYRCKIA